MKPAPVLRTLVILLSMAYSQEFLFSQEDNFNYCQKITPWEDYYIDSTLEKGKKGILLITNRPYLPQEDIKLPNAIARWRKVTYFMAYCNTDKWHLAHIPDLQTGLNEINTGEDILLFVHGHGKTLPMTVIRAYQIHHRYNISTILFDWPSGNNDFNKSLSRVRRCGENFYNLLLQLKDYRAESMDENQHLSVMANSLGNYFISHMVVNGNNQYLNDVFIDNIIFNAAAIKATEQGEVLSQLNYQKRIYVVLNRNDRVLRGAHFIKSGKMLGNFALPPLADNANYIHFTPLAEKEHTYFAGYHQFEYDYPVFYEFYNTILHGGEANLKDSTYYVKRSGGDGYDVLPNNSNPSE